jgi:hypothetical protein
MNQVSEMRDFILDNWERLRIKDKHDKTEVRGMKRDELCKFFIKDPKNININDAIKKSLFTLPKRKRSTSPQRKTLGKKTLIKRASSPGVKNPKVARFEFVIVNILDFPMINQVRKLKLER